MHRVTFAIDAIGRNDPNATQLAIENVGDLMLCLISMNRRYLRHYGSQIPLLYNSGTVYEKLRAHNLYGDDDDWQDIAVTKRLKKGDCEDLVGYRVADLQQRQGVPNAEPYILFQPIFDASGLLEEHRYHILVRWPEGLPRYPKSVYRDVPSRDGRPGLLLEDPSKQLGMRVAA